MRTFTLDDAHTFAQGLIANGWLNDDPDCVDTLHRQLVVITTPPAGYELAPSVATLEMQAAGQACGVNASWSYAKCYRAMLDAQPLITPGALAYPASLTPLLEHVLGYMNFHTCPIAHVFQAAGFPIPRKTEAEQAFVLNRMIRAVLQHGAAWTDVFMADLQAQKATIDEKKGAAGTAARVADNLEPVRKGLQDALTAARKSRKVSPEPTKE